MMLCNNQLTLFEAHCPATQPPPQQQQPASPGSAAGGSGDATAAATTTNNTAAGVPSSASLGDCATGVSRRSETVLAFFLQQARLCEYLCKRHCPPIEQRPWGQAARPSWMSIRHRRPSAKSPLISTNTPQKRAQNQVTARVTAH